MFRKSESLVEKLFQQWLMFCLYPYLTNESSNDYSNRSPARSFFLLYKALKYQTEKGPVDCVTGNSRYSLSEQKLLRETVAANNLVCFKKIIQKFYSQKKISFSSDFLS